jgi:hypothetical protein
MQKKYLIISLIILVIAAINIFVDFTSLGDGNKPFNTVGIVKIQSGDVKIRYPSTTSWIKLKKGDFVSTDSQVYTSENSEAKMILVDGTILAQGSNTLIKIQYKVSEKDLKNDPKSTKIDSLNIDLLDGNVKIISENNHPTKNIKVKESIIELNEKGGSVKIDRTNDQVSVAVLNGQAKVSSGKQSVNVKKGEMVKNIDKTDQKLKKEEVPPELLKQIQSEFSKDLADYFSSDFAKRRSLEYILNEWRALFN